MAKCDRLFVYGTLMSGLPLHEVLREGATYLGRGVVMGLMETPGVAQYGYPLAVKGAGLIHGEVYKVTAPDLCWTRLDRVEQGYKRSVETVCMQWPCPAEGVQYIRAYMYWYVGGHPGIPIPSGDWRVYLREKAERSYLVEKEKEAQG